MIVASAVKDEAGLVHSLPKPARHHHILHKMYDLGLSVSHSNTVQGFLDDQGNFLNRSEAALHAHKCKQLKMKIAPPYIYSEDLW